MTFTHLLVFSLSTGLGVLGFSVWGILGADPLHPPVSHSTVIVERTVLEKGVGLKFEWVNEYDCRFLAIGAAQGSVSYPDELRTQITARFPPEGPRGKGKHRNNFFWEFTTPAFPWHGPDFILTVWHRCGKEDVKSEMFVERMEKIFK